MPMGRDSSPMRGALRWAAGAAASFVLVWALAAVIDGSLHSAVWDEALQRYVLAPGSVIRHRSEGWADMEVGRHGLSVDGAAVLDSGEPVFLMWGDSLVAAHQVSEERKAIALYNAQVPPGAAKGVAVGRSGAGVPDDFFEVPAFEALYPRIRGHILTITKMKDVLPGGNNPGWARFLADPWRLEPGHMEVSELSLKYAPVLQRLRLDLLYQLYAGVRDHDFRFLPGDVSSAALPESGSRRVPLDMEEGWDFLIDALRSRIRKPWVFLYLPMYPHVDHGTVVLSDVEEGLKQRFKAVCEAKGVVFLDASDQFRALYEEEGKLPFGFFNLPPGPTHLNVDGHRALAAFLREKVDF